MDAKDIIEVIDHIFDRSGEALLVVALVVVFFGGEIVAFIRELRRK